jgi:hypothetical protein
VFRSRRQSAKVWSNDRSGLARENGGGVFPGFIEERLFFTWIRENPGVLVRL